MDSTSDEENFESADEDLSTSDDSDSMNDLRKSVKKFNLLSTEEAETETVAKNYEKGTQDDTQNKENSGKEEQKQESGKSTGETKETDNLWDDNELDWAKEASKDDDDKEDTENLWENDNWETLSGDEDQNVAEHIHPKLEAKKYDQNTPESSTKPPKEITQNLWSLSSWGVGGLLSSASQGVSTLTQGLTSVIGVPEPEELAKQNQATEAKRETPLLEDQQSHDQTPTGFGLNNIVSGVTHLTKFVESTGTKVISGGLDTLETIGKKTMEVLQEGDPGLKKKRAFLKIDNASNRPCLSQLLREAKEKSEALDTATNISTNNTSKQTKKLVLNYETLFDDNQGLVHLEALEMLSRQCRIKVETVLEREEDSTELVETLSQVKELCELPEEDENDSSKNKSFDEISETLNAAITEINVPLNCDTLIETWRESDAWLEDSNSQNCDESELHQQAIETLAKITAIAMEHYHKCGELLLVKERRSTADEADSLVQITVNLVALIGITADRYSEKLNQKGAQHLGGKETLNGLITNVFFEAANSSSYIQDAFQLLLPVLQVGAI